MVRPKTLRPADFAVMTTEVLLNVRHDLATPADQHPMMAPGPVRVVHRGDVLAQPEISADTAPSPTPNRTSMGNHAGVGNPIRAGQAASSHSWRRSAEVVTPVDVQESESVGVDDRFG